MITSTTPGIVKAVCLGARGSICFLFDCRYFGPILADDVLGRSSLHNELPESTHSHTSPSHAPECGHPRVVPAPDSPAIDNLGELSFR